MNWVRVAVASSNGSDIDQTLQEASLFTVYDVALESLQLVERRDAREAFVSDNYGEASSEMTVDELMELISDCSILIVRSLGVAAGGKMQLGWITVYEAEMKVEKALAKLSRSPLFRNALGDDASASRRTAKF